MDSVGEFCRCPSNGVDLDKEVGGTQATEARFV